MIYIQVNISDIKKTAAVKLQGILTDKELLHDAIRAEAEALIRNHLLKLNSRSPNTGYYAKAASGVNSTADENQATVIIQQAGIALRRHGGTVVAGKTISTKTGNPTKSIALPTKYVPITNQRRANPVEIADLVFIPNKKGGNTSGYLVEGERYTRSRGKNKGKEGIRAKKGGNIMFVLRKETSHTEDPSILPADDEIKNIAEDAIKKLLETYES